MSTWPSAISSYFEEYTVISLFFSNDNMFFVAQDTSETFCPYCVSSASATMVPRTVVDYITELNMWNSIVNRLITDENDSLIILSNGCVLLFLRAGCGKFRALLRAMEA